MGLILLCIKVRSRVILITFPQSRLCFLFENNNRVLFEKTSTVYEKRKCEGRGGDNITFAFNYSSILSHFGIVHNFAMLACCRRGVFV